jgi:zinc protease
VTERSVILEERSERVDSTAGGVFNEQMRATLYNNHPYGIPIIGWRHEMEQLDREALIEFYDAHYWPNNAVLVVAGDVTPDEVRAWPRPITARSPPIPTSARRSPPAGAAADRRPPRDLRGRARREPLRRPRLLPPRASRATSGVPLP